MKRLKDGLRIQMLVVKALMIRELTTRFGRENIGFLWLMAEPLMFAGLVGLVWTLMKGTEMHGISVVAFVVSGYVPLTFFRHGVSKSANIFVANGALLYHRQVKILDFIFVRVLIEMIGSMMAFVFIAVILGYFELFPMPHDLGYLLAGWGIYVLFVLSICTVIAPLSEVSELVEKLIPVTTYIAIPFSGTFNLVSWLAPEARSFLMWSPMVSGMELMRYGIFGSAMQPYYDISKAITVSVCFLAIGLLMCRRIRRTLVIG
ncbi:ABC transporter permease [Sphingobium sp. HDIP04]|uniref:ABC transporter permease n=1 Tax=Sphingobium sp. HDIP04 TaxID=428994 RepID=UPI0003878671|nr:ABC transporter permease [Sphingobium sp. HDIP04]EQA97220.1 capsule polysaccharide transporter [Sphingobium sp. HDIP04]